MLQPLAGGAAGPAVHHAPQRARPDLYLRIAPELYLKRCSSAASSASSRSASNFRNEGVSLKHNPEFTMLEIYQAYADYNDIMRLVEEMIRRARRDVARHDRGRLRRARDSI